MDQLVIVGEDNPYSDDPSNALYHLPRYAAGDRLRMHLGLRDATYEKLKKVNLCGRRWSMPEARAAAAELLRSFPLVVMLGAKVKAAFGVPKMEVFSSQGILVALPHPSGRCRQWNALGARGEAIRLLRRVASDVPWGEIYV